MKKLLFGLILLLFSVSAMAQGPPEYPRDLTLTWTWPTTYADTAATLLEPGILQGGEAFCFDNQQTLIFEAAYPITSGIGLEQSETFVGVIPAPGTYSCFVTAITIPLPGFPDGISSDFSDPSTVKYTGKPSKPSGLSAKEPAAGGGN